MKCGRFENENELIKRKLLYKYQLSVADDRLWGNWEKIGALKAYGSEK